MLQSLLSLFLQLIMSCHLLEEEKLMNLPFISVFYKISLFHAQFVLILFHYALMLRFGFLLLFFMFALFNPKLSCSFCYVIDIHLVLDLFGKIKVS